MYMAYKSLLLVKLKLRFVVDQIIQFKTVVKILKSVQFKVLLKKKKRNTY